MKRILIIALVLAISICFSACGNNDEAINSDITSGQSQIEVSDATNTSTKISSENDMASKPAENTTTSSVSTLVESNNTTTSIGNTTSEHTHIYSNATCTSPAKCSCGAIRDSALGHSFSQGKCYRCGVSASNHTPSSDVPNSSPNNTEKYTKGLRLGDCMWGDGYSVWGIGTATDTNIIIPSTYNGKPVIEIYENAFKDCANIKSVSIPSSVLEISTNAFSGCTSLEIVSITEGLTTISPKAFYNCDSLKQINIPNSIESISKNSFENCDNLKYNESNNGLYLGNQSNPYIALITAKTCDKLILNNQTKFIAHDALSNNLQIKQVIISNSVRFIGRNAFLGCKNLTNITFGNGLERIYINAFKDCKSLESAVFAQNRTWGINKYGYGTNLTTISTNDASANAYNLKNKYCDYFWGNELVPKTFKQCKSCVYTQNANNLKCAKCGISNWHR